MGLLSEEAFRAVLDERGLLRPGVLVPPERDAGYAVFAQSRAVRLDREHLKRQAAQFFALRLGFTVDAHHDAEPPEVDAARIVVSGEAASGTRLVYGRAATPSDLAQAGSAERAMGTYGLALLARRCPTLWLVESERGADGDDRVALTIAAVLASVLLGPILSPGGTEILGVRSARLKLEGRASPYR